MKPSDYLRRYSTIGGLALALAFTTVTPSAQANVFASNVKINAGVTNVSVAQGTNVYISYILNEPASAGVTVKVFSGATAVRTLSRAGGSAGTARGTNTVVWDGKNDSGSNVPGGDYSASITTSSRGYSGWTVTSDDNNDGNYSWEPRGIAVVRNTNSPYYGRVFVGNAIDNSVGGTSPYYGDYVGIQKLNADGSYADEGGFSTGGVAWEGGLFAPWKIRVSDDDKVYIMDWYDQGVVYRFDAILSTNSMLQVLRPDNDGLASLSGIAVAGTGGSTLLWMADNRGDSGILKYTVTSDGTCATNDTGKSVVGVGGSLDSAPYDVALDRRGNIYTIQNFINPGNPSVRVLAFPAYDPATNGNSPEFTNTTWVAGAGDDTYAGAHGLAVDPTGTYLAVACSGVFGASGFVGNGSTTVFYATNGAVVTNIDLGLSLPSKHTTNSTSPLATQHTDMDCDWDAVGNLYYLDSLPGVWRAVSPPGTNQATTVALPIVRVIASVVQPPYITGIDVSAGMLTIHFTGATSDPASVFVLLGASAAPGPYSPAAGAVITGSGGTFQATVPINGAVRYYRIERLAIVPLYITNLKVAGGTVTLDFTGSSGDSPSALTLLSSASVNGPYTPAAGASIIQVSPGVFQATVPTSGPRQFYRVARLADIPLHITNLKVAGGTVTLNFTASPTDSPSAFTLLSSSSVNGTYAAAVGANISQVSAGLFQATVPAIGPSQFYRIRK